MQELVFFEVVNGIVQNAAVFGDEKTALEMGFLPAVEGVWIGDKYPFPPTVEELAQENKLLKAQIQACSANVDFLEECIVEMANIIYA